MKSLSQRFGARPARRQISPTSLMAGLVAFVERLYSPKSIPVILGFFCALLISVAIVAVGASEPVADLSGFQLPEDGTMTAILLDSLSAGERPEEEPNAVPALPMTVSLSSYKVARNDTLDGISRRFGVRLDTLISVNGITDARRIAAGMTLKIPSLDGIVHTVRKGENLSGIAGARGVSVLDLIDANDLSSQTILPGQSLFIPGAKLSSYDLRKALGKLVIWPVNGRISSSFGYRSNPFTGIRQFHNGLDIVLADKSPIKAAIDGRVAETGYSALFGNFVILSHPDGYQTLYAHMSTIIARQGTTVPQGSVIGLVGTTGYSTGPHLHFGVFKNGKATDPLKLLGGK